MENWNSLCPAQIVPKEFTKAWRRKLLLKDSSAQRPPSLLHISIITSTSTIYLYHLYLPSTTTIYVHSYLMSSSITSVTVTHTTYHHYPSITTILSTTAYLSMVFSSTISSHMHLSQCFTIADLVLYTFTLVQYTSTLCRSVCHQFTRERILYQMHSVAGRKANLVSDLTLDEFIAQKTIHRVTLHQISFDYLANAVDSLPFLNSSRRLQSRATASRSRMVSPP